MVEITPSEPQFIARYVGKTEVYVAVGRGCTQEAVQRIWDNCYDERGMDRVSLLINCSGIQLRDVDKKSSSARIYRIQDIAYCSAERGLHDRVFSWIHRQPDSGRLECHAVLCAAPERAQLMALVLHRAFHVAYKDWKRAKEKRRRSRAAIAGGRRLENGVTSDVPIAGTNGDEPRRTSANVSDESDVTSEGDDSLMETVMAQMNIVEEEEISLTDNSNIGL